jgi:hypothetical protein
VRYQRDTEDLHWSALLCSWTCLDTELAGLVQGQAGYAEEHCGDLDVINKPWRYSDPGYLFMNLQSTVVPLQHCCCAAQSINNGLQLVYPE